MIKQFSINARLQVQPVEHSEKEVYTCWALSQVRYMLGDAHHSLLAGFGRQSDPPSLAQDPAQPCVGLDNATVPCDTFTSLFRWLF